MMIDSEKLKEYVNYICVKNHDVMTKKAILHCIKLIEDTTEEKDESVRYVDKIEIGGMAEILRIIKDYKETLAIQPGMSDYRKDRAKINAFDDILKEVEWMEQKKEI